MTIDHFNDRRNEHCERLTDRHYRSFYDWNGGFAIHLTFQKRNLATDFLCKNTRTRGYGFSTTAEAPEVVDDDEHCRTVPFFYPVLPPTSL